jgi:hypothetical protein
MAGELASLLISRVAVPVLYSMLARRRERVRQDVTGASSCTAAACATPGVSVGRAG